MSDGPGDDHPSVLQDDDNDIGEGMMMPPSNRSTGGTPLRRSSPALLHPSRPGSATRSTTAIVSNPRDGLLRRLSYEELRDRPSSNPRTRTPMRYESPLNPNAFRTEGQRVTVRPLAGAAVGTTLVSRRLQDERSRNSHQTVSRLNQRSSKQGPSHHKVRRWNNDNFVGVASDLARHSKPGVAEALLMAQADAPLYRSIYPQPHRPSVLTTFVQDDNLALLRHRFVEGEIGHATSRKTTTTTGAGIEVVNNDIITPTQMLNRIHARLRSVVVRACTSSEITRNVVDALEAYLIRCFLEHEEEEEEDTIKTRTGGTSNTWTSHPVDTLLEFPLVTKRRRTTTTTTTTTGHPPDIISTVVQFHFDASHSNGGFHRLLLHALCQFHGVTATSTTVTLPTTSTSTTTTTTSTSTSTTPPTTAVAAAGAEEKVHPEIPTKARLLTVTGKTILGATIKLTDHIIPPPPRHQDELTLSYDTQSNLQPVMVLPTSVATM